ncbi:polymeric immunoglobulin receptor-like [Pseudophryne corroboree]|uniref:polymeric immunoglobulin receptor-like n=1 Tax=Pseudophryne corroboree TaxID=495146 RepID=UPI003081EC24
MGLFILWLSVLMCLTPALISAYRVTAVEGEGLVLPCAYPSTSNVAAMCWGRGGCSAFGCNRPIAKVNASRVSWIKSDRYTFPGNLEFGEVSMKLGKVTVDDAGTYCCFVKIPGLGIELKKEVTVEIQEAMKKDNTVSSSVGDTVTLPCKYNAEEGVKDMCWGRGDCGLTGCTHQILKTDGNTVISRESSRYQLLGDITKGDVSLTISGLSKDEEGEYCCRVRIPGWFNDKKKDIKLEIQDVDLVKGSLEDRVTLPCSYSADNGPNPTCWGRGHCRLLFCDRKVLTTEEAKVSWREADRFQLLGNIEKGNVSLTINGATADDGGVYCCRVDVPGILNDIKKEVRLQIHDGDHVKGLVGDTLTLPCSYNVSEGTTTMCWGRGRCPVFKCSNTLVWTDGEVVTWAESDRYKLRENIARGDVSLTIKRVMKEDEGTYCCRVETPGILNDKIKEITVEVEDDGFQTRH